MFVLNDAQAPRVALSDEIIEAGVVHEPHVFFPIAYRW
jgi:hypothetical protein